MSLNGLPMDSGVDMPLLSVDDLRKYYPMRGGILHRTIAWVKAVDGVSFEVNQGETFGLVGETGSGKTTVGRALLRLVPANNGRVVFAGQDVFSARGTALKRLRREMQIVFQDPYGSLDPRMQIGDIVREPLNVHGIGDRAERNRVVQEALEMVGLRWQHAHRYPHEFSGGQRQRIGIARALVLKPRFLICDEPVSALDVSIQSQILNLLRELQRELGLTMLFIAHNLAIVKYMSDRIGVMYLGKIVETADSDLLYESPLHPYTQALLSAIPTIGAHRTRARTILSGDIPSPINPPSGCRFHPRCSYAIDICRKQEPVLSHRENGHMVACHVS